MASTSPKFSTKIFHRKKPMRLNDLRIGKRLGLAFGGIAIGLSMTAAFLLWEIAVINQRMDLAMEEAAKMAQIKEVSTAVDNIYLELWGLGVYQEGIS
jgi:hypothetical protein